MSPTHAPKPNRQSGWRLASSYVNTTSSAVSSLPSWNVVSTSRHVMVSPSSEMAHGSAARSGTAVNLSSYR